MTNSELRARARGNLTGNYRVPMGAFLFSQLLVSLLSYPFQKMVQTQATPSQEVVYYIAMFLISLLECLLIIGEVKIHFSIIRKQPCSLGDLFYCFKNRPDRFIVGSFIELVLLGIWFIPTYYFVMQAVNELSWYYAGLAAGTLFIGLAISTIISLHIGFFIYLLMDYPNATIKECFIHSSEMLKGNRGKFFGMACSFIGMVFLSIISFGIGFFWTEPYMHQSFCLFYMDVKGELSSIENKDSSSKENPTFNQYV